MGNMLARATAWLADKTEAFAASEVTYVRGAHSVTFSATIGRLLLRTTDKQGTVKTELTDRDFIFKAARLILDGSQTTPHDGDEIHIAFGTVTKIFTLRPFGDERCWRYSDDQGEVSIRVHTKFTGTA